MIALVDCVTYFVSAEMRFRPDLWGKAVCVASPNDGCIVAMNDQTKALGIKKFAPVFEYAELMKRNNVKIFSSNFPLYGCLSERVMNTLATFAHDISIYSIDESWLDLRGRTEDLRGLGHNINSTVFRDVGIPTRYGAAETKCLAKVASIIAKKVSRANGVCVIDDEKQRRAILNKFPAASVWGIGRQLNKRLEQDRIYTALQLADADKKWLRKYYNVNVERISRELCGEQCLSFHEDVNEQKQIVVSRAFGAHITDLAPLQSITAGYLTKAMEKLRRNKQLVKSVSVSISTSRFKNNYVSYHKVFLFPAPTNDTLTVTRYLSAAIASIYRPAIYVRSTVCLTDLCKDSHYQGDLLQEEQSSASRQLMATLDGLNVGNSKTVFLARTGSSKKFEMRQASKSPNYTTSWSELPKVKC